MTKSGNQPNIVETKPGQTILQHVNIIPSQGIRVNLNKTKCKNILNLIF